MHLLTRKKQSGGSGRQSAGFVAAAVTGAIGAYLFDPRSGAARRSKITDKLGKWTRRSIRQTEQRARYMSGKLKGARHAASGNSSGAPENDQTLVQKIRSEVLGDPDFHRVNVTAEHGRAVLHGEVSGPDKIEELEERVAGVAGVAGVLNHVHTAGEPAPNTEAAIHAGR